MLHGILYVSKEVSTLSDQDLNNISTSSTANNEKNQITGALLYMEGEFLQILEGDEKKLIDTYQRIDTDSRHQSVKPIYQGLIKERAFTQWKMQCSRVDADKFRQRTGFDTFSAFFQKISDDKVMEMGIMLSKEFAKVTSQND